MSTKENNPNDCPYLLDEYMWEEGLFYDNSSFFLFFGKNKRYKSNEEKLR